MDTQFKENPDDCGVHQDSHDFSMLLHWMGIEQWLPCSEKSCADTEFLSAEVTDNINDISIDTGCWFSLQSNSKGGSVIPRAVVWVEFAPGRGSLSSDEQSLLSKMFAAIELECNPLPKDMEGYNSFCNGNESIIIKLHAGLKENYTAATSDLEFSSYSLCQISRDVKKKRHAWDMLQRLRQRIFDVK